MQLTTVVDILLAADASVVYDPSTNLGHERTNAELTRDVSTLL